MHRKVGMALQSRKVHKQQTRCIPSYSSFSSNKCFYERNAGMHLVYYPYCSCWHNRGLDGTIFCMHPENEASFWLLPQQILNYYPKALNLRKHPRNKSGICKIIARLLQQCGHTAVACMWPLWVDVTLETTNWPQICSLSGCYSRVCVKVLRQSLTAPSQGAAGPNVALSGGVQFSQPEVQTEAEVGLR